MTSRYFKKRLVYREPTQIIIAVEGHKREKEYFAWFEKQSSRIVVLEPKKEFDEKGNEIDHLGKSNYRSILNRLTDYIKVNGIDVKQGDQVWIVMDCDHFRNDTEVHEFHNLFDPSPNRQLALSNPCFEIWLAYHVTLEHNDIVWKNCGEVKTWLGDFIVGGFHARDVTEDKVKTAINNAKNSDKKPGHFIPDNPGSKVYTVAEQLMEAIRVL